MKLVSREQEGGNKEGTKEKGRDARAGSRRPSSASDQQTESLGASWPPAFVSTYFCLSKPDHFPITPVFFFVCVCVCLYFLFFCFFFLILKSLILTSVPKHEPPSHLPPHKISLGHPHAPAPSCCFYFHVFGRLVVFPNLGEGDILCVQVAYCLCSVTSLMSGSLQPCGLQPARLLCPWDSPGKNTRVCCFALLKGIFPTQGLNHVKDSDQSTS